jgi:hypothetical protein
VPWIISECAKIEDMGLEGCLLDHRNRGCAILVHALIQSLNVREAAALLGLKHVRLWNYEVNQASAPSTSKKGKRKSGKHDEVNKPVTSKDACASIEAVIMEACRDWGLEDSRRYGLSIQLHSIKEEFKRIISSQ